MTGPLLFKFGWDGVMVKKEKALYAAGWIPAYICREAVTFLGGVILCYIDKKEWRKLGSGEYESGDGRFYAVSCCQKNGSQYWTVKDSFTKDVRYKESFHECRDAAQEMAMSVRRRNPSCYKAGMEAWTMEGERCRILSPPNTDDEYASCDVVYIGGSKDGEVEGSMPVSFLCIGSLSA